MDENQRPNLNPGIAVLIGHLVVNVPVLILILGMSVLGWYLLPGRFWWLAFFGIGFVLAWSWWSLLVPLWRRWAIRRGADPDRLQKLAVMTGLVWPKGWIFEKTEFRYKEED